MPLKVGDTFLMHGTGGPANPEGAHLMVCLAIDKAKGSAVIVPIVTRHELSDTSCVLDDKDHIFLKHESCAAYDFARLVSLRETDDKIAKRQLKLRAPVDDDVIKRLQIGFVLSDELAPWIYQAGNGPALTRFLRGKGLID